MQTENKPMTRATNEPPALRDAPCCGATRRDGCPCKKPRMRGKTRCRLRGGVLGSGAPRGERNGRYRTGQFTAEAIEERQVLRELVSS
jgi:glucans biosynthesis protein